LIKGGFFKIFGGVFAAIALLAALILGLIGGFSWAINAFTAAFGAFCAAAGTFFAYRNLVLQAAKNSDGVLDAIDDKEGLYEEDAPIAPESVDRVDQSETAAPDQAETRDQTMRVDWTEALDRADQTEMRDLVDQRETAAPNQGDRAETAEPKIPLKTKLSYGARSLSFFRLFGYLPLIAGFFALHSSSVFAPLPFLIALASLPIAALTFAFIVRNKNQ
jgi:hypothetical protein